MTDEERYELVQLRKENAQRTLREAKLMLDNGYWNEAVNRIYYTYFYTVTALVIITLTTFAILVSLIRRLNQGLLQWVDM